MQQSATAAARRSLACSGSRTQLSPTILRSLQAQQRRHLDNHDMSRNKSSSQSQVEFGEVLWFPSQERIGSSRMVAFARIASERNGQDLSSWPELHRWSVSQTGPFWQTVSDFCGIKWLDRGDGEAYTPPPTRGPGTAGEGVGGEEGERAGLGMRGARWFDGATLNFAHNMLPPSTDEQVLVSVSESQELPSRSLTGRELHVLVARCVRALRAAGVRKGDRVAGVMTNSQEALVCMLGVTAVGAIWSSCSPDFGVEGVVDRLGQLSPKLVFFSLGYLYGGRWHDCRALASGVLERLPGFPMGVGVPYWSDSAGQDSREHRAYDDDDNASRPSSSHLPSPLLLYSDFLNDSAQHRHGGASVGGDGGGGGVGRVGGSAVREEGKSGGAERRRGGEEGIDFEPTAFDHPVFIMFSSGTTGLPKCMVHGAGGTLLQQKKELELHCDLKRGDRLMFFSTLGWMMWNWAAAALSVDGASLVAFDGSPGHPDLGNLWRVAAREGVTHLGASPKYFGACRDKGVVPAVYCARVGGLGKLRTVLSTGSPLLPEHFQWIYQAVKPDIHLASISGGTDILGCFALGNPTLPVRAGHLQCVALGMDVCAYRQDDGNDDAASASSPLRSRMVSRGEMGELVCRRPFPSMPVYFWGDEDGAKYRSAYFEAFQGEEVWAHGDYIKITEEGGVVISGRSDAVLNPGGIRIGTAEIYRQVERVPEVQDSIAVGLRVDGDVQVILFVKLAKPDHGDGGQGRRIAGGSESKSGSPSITEDSDGSEAYTVSPTVEHEIKTVIRSNLTARHVPSRVLGVRDIPYTRSGKKVEVAVTKAIHGEPLDNISALANPGCLTHFQEAGRILRDSGGASRATASIPSRL